MSQKLWIVVTVFAIAVASNTQADAVPRNEVEQAKYVGCFERSVGDWLGVVEPIVDYQDSMFLKTTTIEQYFSTPKASVKALIVVSQSAGAILQVLDPRNLGGSMEGDRAFADGIVANVENDKITTRVGPVGITWRVVLGEVGADDLWELASFSVDRQCLDSITKGEE